MQHETVFWKVIKFVLMLPLYVAFGIIWLGVMPALMYGMIKAAIITIWKMI